MKKTICILLLLILCMPSVCHALDISAEYAVLYEPVTKRVLFEKNATTPTGIASTTKIVTAITAIEHGTLTDIVTTSKKAADVEGSSIWLEEGEKQTLENLLYGLLLASGNDAAIAIAEHVGKSEDVFINLMNQTAKTAGATQSNFMNPSGLDHENHYATALDLAKITAYAEQNSTFKTIFSTKQHAIPWEGHEWNRVIKNHNRLLKEYAGCDGGKTGFTKKCGRCLVSTATRDGVHLIAVTLKAPNDWSDHKNMLDYGFGLLKTRKIIDKNSFAGNIGVLNGLTSVVKTQFENEVVLPLTDDEKAHVNIILPEKTEAPVKKGASVGYAEIVINGEVVKKTNIIAAQDCKKVEQITFKKCFLSLLKSCF